MVKMNASDSRAFKKPSHLTPTEPPDEPTLEASLNDPDPQSSRIDGSTLQIVAAKRTGDVNGGLEADVNNGVTCFFSNQS